MATKALHRALLIAAGLLMQSYASAEVKAANADEGSPAKSTISVEAPRGVQGLWVWRRQQIETPEAQDKLLAFCKERGINRLLVQIHTVANWTAPDSPKSAQLAIPDGLRSLLKKAAAAGVAVEALDGAKDMAMKKNWPRAHAILDAVIEFNRSQPVGERFAGMHYDIEPYIMPEWKTDARAVIMDDYLHFLKQARQKLHAETPKMLLSADIPMWYDRKVEPGDTCILEFDGQTKNLHEHVQDLCDYIGIMSYRRHATGSNSVVFHVEAEVAYAAKIGKTACAALETIELKSDPQLTFFGQGSEAFLKTKAEVEQALADNPGFGGMLIHSYDGLQALFAEKAE